MPPVIEGKSASGAAIRQAAYLKQGLRPTRLKPTLATGIPGIDELTDGFPRGAISEITGTETSGRSTLLNCLLASATRGQEVCAYVDANNSFDPLSAAKTGVMLSRLIWVRCQHSPEQALKAVDYLLHAGGFGVVTLDLSLLTQRQCRRIPMSYWFRFRHAVENTPTILVLVEREAMAKSCASLQLEMRRTKPFWSGSKDFWLLRGAHVQAASLKPLRSTSADLKARVI